jgi:glucose-6-phosphate 1-epimerase
MGSKTLLLKHSSGSKAEIYLFGATVTSFYAAKEPEHNILFLSNKAALDGSKPIRGGIPLVFPIFGSAPGFPNHGFARTSLDWKPTLIEQVQGDAESPTIAKFTLCSSDTTNAMWPHDFELEYEVKLYANSLLTALHVRNTGTESIAFQALLHTYLKIDDVRNEGALVEGLQGVEFHDKLTSLKQKDTRSAISFNKETDSVYANAPSTISVKIRGADKTRTVVIEKSAFLDSDTVNGVQSSDAVVWNPWIEKSKSMSDFGDEEYINMLCVEPGRVSEKQNLAAGKKYTLQQIIKA